MILKQKENRYLFQAKDDNGNAIPIIGATLAVKYAQKEFRCADVIEAWRQSGIDTTILEKGVNRMDAIVRALNKMKQDSMLKEIARNATSIRYQFTEEFVSAMANGKQILSFRAKEFVVYDIGKDVFFFENEKGEFVDCFDKSEKLKELVKYCSETFTNADVSRYTRRILQDCHQIGMAKGMYFVPARYLEIVYKLEKSFEILDPKGIFVLNEIPDMKRSKRAIAKSSEDIVKEKVKGITEKIAERLSAKKEMTRTISTNWNGELLAMLQDTEILVECTENSMTDSKFAIGIGNLMLQSAIMNNDLYSLESNLLRSILEQFGKFVEDLSEFGFSEEKIEFFKEKLPERARTKLLSQKTELKTVNELKAPEVEIEL